MCLKLSPYCINTSSTKPSLAALTSWTWLGNKAKRFWKKRFGWQLPRDQSWVYLIYVKTGPQEMGFTRWLWPFKLPISWENEVLENTQCGQRWDCRSWYLGLHLTIVHRHIRICNLQTGRIPDELDVHENRFWSWDGFSSSTDTRTHCGTASPHSMFRPA